MHRVCVKCGDINFRAAGDAREACPACGAIYSKARPRSAPIAKATPETGGRKTTALSFLTTPAPPASSPPGRPRSRIAAVLVGTLLAAALGVGAWMSLGQSPPAAVAAAPEPTRIEDEAERCLKLYALMLRDPKSAYWSAPEKRFYILTMTVHATNAFGGFVQKTARCWVENGQIDSAHSLVFAREDGWLKP